MKSKSIIIASHISQLKWAAIVFFSFFLVFKSFSTNRIGDGSEYILQYLSLIHSHTPWINNSDLDIYRKFYESNEIGYLVDPRTLYEASPSLHKETSFDLNHFWLYSALAAFCHLLFGLLMIETSVSSSFLILHAALIALVAQTAYRKHKIPGLIAVFSLLLTSPMLWFTNKIHTEFFTFCLVMLAVIYVFNSNFLPASFSLAMASTQNISFGVLAGIILACHFIFQKEERSSGKSVVLSIVTIFLTLLHPVYYWFRQDVITPQLKAGFVNVNSDFRNFFVWLIDPDIGLITNWPFGIMLLILFARSLRRRAPFKVKINIYIIFVLLFLLVSLYAQSSTLNINSGATTGPSRYGLWYIGLFFPIALRFFKLEKAERFRGEYVVSLICFSLLFLASIYSFAPNRSENYSSPSKVSRAIQTMFPKFYNPPPELFMERYSGYGESRYISIVIGPDCKKTLIRPIQQSLTIAAPRECNYSIDRIGKYVIDKKLLKNTDYYFNIPEEDILSIRIKITTSKIFFGQSGNGTELFTFGWSSPEEWGTWSEGKKSTLVLPCRVYSNEITQARLTAGSFGVQKIVIGQVGSESTPTKYIFKGGIQEIQVGLDPRICRNGFHYLEIGAPDAISPKSKGISEDSRELGISLVEVNLG